MEGSKKKWKDRVDRMAESRLLNTIKKYRPIEKIDLGRLRKRRITKYDKKISADRKCRFG